MAELQVTFTSEQPLNLVELLITTLKDTRVEEREHVIHQEAVAQGLRPKPSRWPTVPTPTLAARPTGACTQASRTRSALCLGVRP
jgi:hypothetical protein